MDWVFLRGFEKIYIYVYWSVGVNCLKLYMKFEKIKKIFLKFLFRE